MAYMARDPSSREDIRGWFPEAKTVVLCGFSCFSPAPAGTPAGGRLARYALPPDYHEALRPPMRSLLRWCSDILGAAGRLFIDSSPVLERRYGWLAGLGWVGKNSMLISREIGSHFVVAGLALDKELPPDRPQPDRCGRCERCLRACPVEALRAPRLLDASRCVSYHTIENRKAPIPEPLRAGHGNWLFGCDACQDVCPWNRFARPGTVLEPALPGLLDPRTLTGCGAQEFNARFRGTPLRRTGRAALERNALLVLGNSGGIRSRGPLERAARSEDPVAAEQARWSLARLLERSRKR